MLKFIFTNIYAFYMNNCIAEIQGIFTGKFPWNFRLLLQSMKVLLFTDFQKNKTFQRPRLIQFYNVKILLIFIRQVVILVDNT